MRVDEADRLRADKQARKVVKTARRLLVRNRESIRRDADRVKPDDLLHANRTLMCASVLKDDLKQLRRYTDGAAARAAREDGLARAVDSGIKPLIAFARKLTPSLDGILAHCRRPPHTSLLESINNKIKVIKRVACGFRDDTCFFLEIRAAFPGIPR